MTDEPLRVIQWTTGNIGRRSLHAIIGRPDMELVGVYAHGPDKVGQEVHQPELLLREPRDLQVGLQ